jgi:hypothetical protein
VNLSIFRQISRLRAVLEEMEMEIGLRDLSRNERDIYLAFCETAHSGPTGDDHCSTETVRLTPIVRDISQPTFHRTLKQLIKRGLIERCEGAPTGQYRLTNRTPSIVQGMPQS